MKLFGILLLSLISFGSMAQKSQYTKVAGVWQGTISAQGQTRKVLFHITFDGTELSATLDSPDQNATGLKVDEISFVEGVLKMKVNVVQGTYEGTLGNNKVEGKWSQWWQSIDLNLDKIRKKGTS